MSPPVPVVALTAFDRMVLAVLVGSGGWNARSRGRLTALASQHGVSVTGLIQVVTGLAGHVRSHGARFTPGDMMEGASLIHATHRATPSRLEAVVDRITEAMGDELRSERLAPRLRVTSIFVVATLAMVIILVRVLMIGPPTAASEEADLDAPGLVDGTAPPSGPTPTDGTTGTMTAGLARPDVPIRSTVLRPRFDRIPTFRGERRPVEALELAEAARRLPGALQRLALAAAVERTAATAAFERDWAESLREAAGSWPLADRGGRRSIEAGFIEVLRAAGGSGNVERLLPALAPPANVPSGAVPMWSASFRSGMLAEIAARASTLAPSVLQRARELAVAAGMHQPLFGFDEGAAAWLDLHAQTMIQRLTVDPGFADDWEAWIEAQRALHGDRPRFQRALAGAIGELLRSGLDVTTTGPPSDLLGRLCRSVDFADDPVVREMVLGWFADARVSSQGLWILTHMLLERAGVRWMSEEMLLDWAATGEQRDAIAELIASRWRPAEGSSSPGGGIVQASGDAIDAWRSALRQVEALAARATDAPSRMRALVLTAMLNEAAAEFDAGREPRGRAVVARLGAALAPTGDAEWPPRGRLAAEARGQAIGPDGDFAKAMSEAERNVDAQLGFLRQLRVQSGGDLGPIDAEALVRTAWRPTRPEIGSVARAVLIESFRFGPTVVLEMLDQLPDAPPTDDLAQIVAQFADRTLPSVRSPTWKLAARRALLGRVLLLQSDPLAAVDTLSNLLAESLRGRFELLPTAGASEPSADDAPDELLRRVVDEWRRRADSVVTLNPLPGPLAELDRLRQLRQRLAIGGITSFVAEQLTHVDLAAYLFSARAPWLAAPIEDVLREGSEQRRQMDSALAQAVAAELTLAHLWELALTGTIGVGSSPAPLPESDGAPQEALDDGTREPSAPPIERRVPTDSDRHVPEPIAPPGAPPSPYLPPGPRR